MNIRTIPAVMIAAGLLSSTATAAPSMEEMWAIIQQQQAEIAALKKAAAARDQQLQTTVIQVNRTEQKAEAIADVMESNTGGSAVSWADKTSIGGYGEHHYNDFDGGTDSEATSQVDAHRYVLYVGHEYSDTVRFFSEWELEHSLAGKEGPGEVELEQAFIQWDFTENHSLTAGQFLIPIGIMNETHEPDTFYGTERNLVEKEVIPATWWETGLMVQGRIGEGWSYDVALHSGLAIPADELRIRSGRQKSAEANAEDYAFTSRIKYTGIAGLELAATWQHQSDVTQGNIGFSEGAQGNLFEAHAIYNVGDFGIRALYANWDIDGADFEAAGADDLTGWYIEPSYKVTNKLGVFARYSELDPARGDESTQLTEVYDYGLNYWLNPNVVFKLDYSDHQEAGTDALNVGLGWSF